MGQGYHSNWILPFPGKSYVERQKITQDKATFLNTGACEINGYVLERNKSKNQTNVHKSLTDRLSFHKIILKLQCYANVQ